MLKNPVLTLKNNIEKIKANARNGLALIVFMFGHALIEMVCNIASSISISFMLVFNMEKLVIVIVYKKRMCMHVFVENADIHDFVVFVLVGW